MGWEGEWKGEEEPEGEMEEERKEKRERERKKEKEEGEGGGEGVWDNQPWKALLASICLEIDHMGAFLKSALSIDVKNNLKRLTLVTIKSNTKSQRQMWSDG